MKKIVKIHNNVGVGGTYYLQKKYHLKESVKGVICLGAIAIIIIATLVIQAKRVEDLDNSGESTETQAVNVNIIK